MSKLVMVMIYNHIGRYLLSTSYEVDPTKGHLSVPQLQGTDLRCPMVRKIKFTLFAIHQTSLAWWGFHKQCLAPRLCQFAVYCCSQGLIKMPQERHWDLLPTGRGASVC